MNLTTRRSGPTPVDPLRARALSTHHRMRPVEPDR
jgi:hypothetical protein